MQSSPIKRVTELGQRRQGAPRGRGRGRVQVHAGTWPRGLTHVHRPHAWMTHVPTQGPTKILLIEGKRQDSSVMASY